MKKNIGLRNQIIYSVFVRNHTEEGTFRAVIPDLQRIKDLGTDIIWLMPIHPIGMKNRKGTLGSPYANRDYRSVNPEYGTLEDFQELVSAIHDLGMKCIIDVVYNHTSPDSVLYHEHPEFFYRRPDGQPGNHIGDWSDVIDLDYTVPELWDYQIESLKYWAGIVDGFRCDVASFVPVSFWKKARAAVEEVRPGAIWLAESVQLGFNEHCRHRGMYCAKDTELFEAFDMEYEYDIREAFELYLKGKTTLSHWTDLLNLQEFLYPADHNKCRFLENHDVPRIGSFVSKETDLKNLTAMLYFLKGTVLVYAGQERAASHLPGLFDKDPVDWKAGWDLSAFMSRLAGIRKNSFDENDVFYAWASDDRDIAVCRRYCSGKEKAGIFSLHSETGEVKTEFPDGTYTDLISGEPVTIRDGLYSCSGRPVIFEIN